MPRSPATSAGPAWSWPTPAGCSTRRLGIGRAPLWRVYSPGTLATYAAALARGHRLTRPAEDTRQLGADAIMAHGVVRRLWRPRTPNDRPPAGEVITAARAWPG